MTAKSENNEKQWQRKHGVMWKRSEEMKNNQQRNSMACESESMCIMWRKRYGGKHDGISINNQQASAWRARNQHGMALAAASCSVAKA